MGRRLCMNGLCHGPDTARKQHLPRFLREMNWAQAVMEERSPDSTTCVGALSLASTTRLRMAQSDFNKSVPMPTSWGLG